MTNKQTKQIIILLFVTVLISFGFNLYLLFKNFQQTHVTFEEVFDSGYKTAAQQIFNMAEKGEVKIQSKDKTIILTPKAQ